MGRGKDKEFDDNLRAFFRADRGAYSPVTETEAGDGQITLTGSERVIAVDNLGEEYLRQFEGAKRSFSEALLDKRPSFRIHPHGRTVRPVMNFPKPGDNELRIYFNDDEEFKVSEGSNWGIFERGGNLWLCEISPDMLEKINSGILDPEDRTENLEAETDDFQLDLNNDQTPEKKKSELYQYGRDRKKALEALQKAQFSCELFPEYPTFSSRSSGHPFMEAHHLIPMKLQDSFEKSLDVVENICCLNPLSHRLVHYGQFSAFEERLELIVRQRAEFIRSVGWIEDDVMALYSI